MKFNYAGDAVGVFTISPRTKAVEEYWKNIEQAIAWSDKYDATGILLFEGNDTYVQPWLAANAAFAKTEGLCPLVAVNPVYMHPFTAAKMVSSFAYLYGRKTYLNMITGTALSYLEALDDHLEKEQRYDRLREYAELIGLLTAADGQPVTYQGKYYKTKNLKLDPPVPAELQPVYYIAGQSDAAVETARAIDAVHMQMLPAQLVDDLTIGATGIHFGIVTRPDEADAWQAAKENFPADVGGQRMQTFSMKNTDSVWKQRMMMAAKMAEAAKPGYWVEPFRNFQADCPYFIGSRLQVAELIAQLVRGGIRNIILDIPAAEQEFAEVDAACKQAAQILASDTSQSAQSPIGEQPRSSCGTVAPGAAGELTADWTSGRTDSRVV